MLFFFSDFCYLCSSALWFALAPDHLLLSSHCPHLCSPTGEDDQCVGEVIKRSCAALLSWLLDMGESTWSCRSAGDFGEEVFYLNVCLRLFCFFSFFNAF